MFPSLVGMKHEYSLHSFSDQPSIWILLYKIFINSSYEKAGEDVINKNIALNENFSFLHFRKFSDWEHVYPLEEVIQICLAQNHLSTKGDPP